MEGGGSCKDHLVLWGEPVLAFFRSLVRGGGGTKRTENIVAPVYI